MVLVLLPLLCKHDTLIPKFDKKKSYLEEGLHFIGRFKVWSVPGMINKETLAQLIYKHV